VILKSWGAAQDADAVYQGAVEADVFVQDRNHGPGGDSMSMTAPRSDSELTSLKFDACTLTTTTQCVWDPSLRLDES
jgi:hypothetical protein